jgi:protein tyrosine phosphatase
MNFWRMVWDYDITTIVMLNEDNEGSAHRHADIRRYCPSLLNEWESNGAVDVLKREQVAMRNMGAIVRKLTLRAVGTTGPTKECTHIQFRDWPDGGIPADREDFKVNCVCVRFRC